MTSKGMAMGRIVYKYGLLPPTINADVVRLRMLQAHEYRNARVALERQRRVELREIDSKYADIEQLAEREAAARHAVEEARKTVKMCRSKTRSKSESKELADAVKRAKSAHKEARDALFSRRRELKSDADTASRREAVYARYNELAAEAYAASGIGGDVKAWGIRSLVDDALKASFDFKKTPLYDGAEPNDPRFARWTSEGSLGVQVHQKGNGGHGLTVDELRGGKTRGMRYVDILQRSPCTLEARTGRPREGVGSESAHRDRNAARRAEALASGGGDTRERCTLRMFIGNNEGEPQYAEWPMVLHRPLPEGAIITRASVSVRKIGPRERWTCQITVDTADCKPRESAPVGGGTVAVDIGWLSSTDGLRVATWLDERGNSGLLTLGSNAELGALRKADEVRSVRDMRFNEARDALVSWLRTNGVPTWMRELTVKRGAKAPTHKQSIAYLEAWRSPARLASLARRWRENRSDGDADAFGALESWRYHDHHLWSWESSQREKSVLRRREAYRTFAAKLASTYNRVVFSDAEYDQISRRPDVDGGTHIHAAAANRKNAAPGELRKCIEQAFAARGGDAAKLPAANFSVTCPACGSVDAAHRDERTHETVCLSCTYVRDTDTTMCMNLLRADGCGDAVDKMIERGREIGRMVRDEAAE